MQYFKNFSKVDYKFGDDFINTGGGDEVFELFQDLTSYVDIIDTIKNNSSFYKKYTILENDRPDIVSQKLYGTPAYHWTFYVMNDNIRERGRHLSFNELEKKVKRDFPHQYIEVRDDLTNTFNIGERAVGSQSGASGDIVRKYYDIGVVVIDSSTQFQANEAVTNVSDPSTTKTVTVVATDHEYNAPRHYTDATGRIVDIDPAVGPGALLTEVTQFDHYVNQNEELKTITIIRPDAINSIVSKYFQALSTNV